MESREKTKIQYYVVEADQLTEEMKGRHVQAAKNFGKANLASIFQNDQKHNL